MEHWTRRPVELANLINPAFSSVVLSQAVQGFQQRQPEGMPYALSFLVLPLVLPKARRETLPRSTTTQMHVWLQRNPEVRVRFAEQVRQMVPFTKETLIFAMQYEALQVSETGLLRQGARCPSVRTWQAGTVLSEIARQASFVGRWLSLAGNPTTIYIMWGLRP